jgi:hypothetical protein
MVSDQCPHCNALLKIWDQVTEELLKICPNLRFPIQTVETLQYKYPPIMVKNKTLNTNIFPKDLTTYMTNEYWYPIVLLIPGESWENALNGGKLTNIQILNTKEINGKLKYVPTWDTRKVEPYGLWLKDTLPKMIKPPILTKVTDPLVCSNVIHKLVSR